MAYANRLSAELLEAKPISLAVLWQSVQTKNSDTFNEIDPSGEFVNPLVAIYIPNLTFAESISAT